MSYQKTVIKWYVVNECFSQSPKDVVIGKFYCITQIASYVFNMKQSYV